MTKTDHELMVFKGFAEISGLDIDSGSIKSESPPLPDISCTVSGQKHFFELTRAVDQQIANDIGYVLSEGRKTGYTRNSKIHSYCDVEIITDAVTRKTAKQYETDRDKVDLLIYSDGIYHGRLNEAIIEEEVNKLREQYKDRWGTIWIYDHPKQKLLVKPCK